MRYVHIIVMTSCMLFSLTSVLAMQFSEGYGVSIIAYYHCDSRGANDTFYAVILMLCIILSTGVLMLTMIIWKLADVVRNQYFCINFVHDNSTKTLIICSELHPVSFNLNQYLCI